MCSKDLRGDESIGLAQLGRLTGEVSSKWDLKGGRIQRQIRKATLGRGCLFSGSFFFNKIKTESLQVCILKHGGSVLITDSLTFFI